jgi:phosphocarrier protein
MVTKKVVIKNAAGIHCRPSSVILLTVQKFARCEVLIKSNKGSSDLKSILSLLSIGLEQGDEVTVEAKGEKEAAVCEEISSLFAYEFDFPHAKEETIGECDCVKIS